MIYNIILITLFLIKNTSGQYLQSLDIFRNNQQFFESQENKKMISLKSIFATQKNVKQDEFDDMGQMGELERQNILMKSIKGNPDLFSKALFINRRKRQSIGQIIRQNTQISSAQQQNNSSQNSWYEQSSESSCSSLRLIGAAQHMDSKIIIHSQKLKILFDRPVKFEFLYSASSNQFSAKKFHKKCDKFNHTLVICKTQSGKIVGGYTPLSWMDEFQQNGTYWKEDPDYQSFLFSWDRLQKYHLKSISKNRAICCFKGMGPCFGYDLQIGDDSLANLSTQVNFPINYCCKYNETPSKWDVFGTNKNQIHLQDYEVFAVKIWGQKSRFKRGKQFLISRRVFSEMNQKQYQREHA